MTATAMIDFLSEPSLLFKYGQQVEDPRDGLMLFGPLDEGRPYGIRAGVVGTRDGIDRFSRWVQTIQRPVHDAHPRGARPYFPGFEAVFGIPWDPRPVHEVVVSQLEKSYLVDDVHQRVYRTVDVFSSAIVRAIKEEEAKADVWFVVVPDELFKYCRP